MIDFVPAWYPPERPWYSTEEVWFRGETEPQIDDTVSRLRIFREGDEQARLLILNYAPGLRRTLHAQGLFDVPYWSFFDEVQGLDDDYARPLDFLDLDWPADVAFFYNPFVVTVMRGAGVYARVYLSRAGTLHSVRYYGDGMPTVEHVYDDRGFLSSVLMHDEVGLPVTQYYLSRAGDVIVSEDVRSGRIDVVQGEDERFRHPSYENWEALIADFLAAELGGGGPEDTVVLAVSPQHDALVASALGAQLLVLSCSAARPARVDEALLARAGAVFADFGDPWGDDPEPSGAWSTLPVLSIYPLEDRPGFGASANESRVYVSVFADGIDAAELDFAIATMAPQLVRDRTHLLVCTARPQDLDHVHAVQGVIAGYHRLDLAVLEEDETLRLAVDVGVADEPEEKIQLTSVESEAELSRVMARSRVLVDLGPRPSIRLSAAAIDAGVPQINRAEHELATHRINGYTIGDDDELGAALDYFLNGLEHWNQSLVQCRVLVDLFSPREVLARWELIREGVAHARAADRP
ncbi:accessory Sec system protein Asp1 [Leucobacter massiliensis]|uniref:Accessory Sec system protein Asp1 n=1 Tax=Leucobacter massiliensis TaxID=1686285 RepID=A0A2S9QR64_9MICO|nr:accessory Sec system protein Asp1 [Leucobacter massiliensis]PRI12083.1 accessory Sec system protein Asp1 [Leucobacter massiliensis]